jgi:tripartite motif-containing protein 71
MRRVAVAAGILAMACGCASNTDGGPDDAAADGAAGRPDATDTDACAGCPPTPRFVGFWGGYGTEPGQFIEPSSVELRSDGIVIVAGHEDRIQLFTRDGELFDIFGIPGPGDGQFNHPHGLAVDRDRDDLIYVGDQENHRLQVFDQAGGFERQWGDAEFQHIHDVGIDRDSGNIFVGDYELHRLRKFSATGALLGVFGGPGPQPGQFNGVWGVSTDSAGFVYVGDTFNKRVQKLDRDGVFVDEWTDYGGEAFIKPTGVYVDANDIVYVCDSLAEIVALFDTAGNLLTVWDIRAIYGQRSEPEDIVIDTDSGHIYIGEVYEHRVLHLVLAPPS